jgi:hypothetical protein
VVIVNFVPKEKSKEAIEKLLKRRNERSKARAAGRRKEFLREKYGDDAL